MMGEDQLQQVTRLTQKILKRNLPAASISHKNDLKCLKLFMS